MNQDTNTLPARQAKGRVRSQSIERDADDPRLAEVLITLSGLHVLLGKAATARTEIEARERRQGSPPGTRPRTEIHSN